MAELMENAESTSLLMHALEASGGRALTSPEWALRLASQGTYLTSAEVTRRLKNLAARGVLIETPAGFINRSNRPPPLPRQADDGSHPAQTRLWATLEDVLKRPLDRLGSREHYPLVVAAQEWSLATPILIRTKEDFRALPKISVEPFLHQVQAAMQFFRRLSPRGLVADDVGLGKTITAGLILSELMARKKVNSFLIIAPKLILEQWKSELAEKFGLDAEVVSGATLKTIGSQARAITTYHSASRYMAEIERAHLDLVIFDEVHKLRNLHATRPKMAVSIFEAQTRFAFRFALGLSATPLQNSLLDLYSLADVIRTPDPNPYGSRKHFLATYPDDPPVCRKLRPRVREEFRRRTVEFMHRTARKDVDLRFPDREVRIERVLPLPDEAALNREALQRLVESKTETFARIAIAQTILSSPAAVLERMRDEPRNNPLAPLRAQFEALTETGKLRHLVALCREFARRDPDWRVVVFTIRRATAEYISKGLVRAGLGRTVDVVLGGRGDANSRAVRGFQSDPPAFHVLVSTDSGAEGVNLQKCNVLVNYDLPWNPMLLEQRIGRIQRLGQKAARVVVYNLVTAGSVEEKVVSRLYEKLALYDAAIGMVEEILGQIEGDDERDFSTTILELIEAAVLRGDVEHEIQRIEKSHVQAREELERQRRELDAILGSVDDAEAPQVPDIRPASPSMPAKEFWRKGMEADGWEFVDVAQGVLEGSAPRYRNRRFTYDADSGARSGEHPLGTYGVELVAPQERAFDEVIARWSRFHIDALEYLRAPGEAQVREWLLRTQAGRVKRVGLIKLASRGADLEVAPAVRANVSVFHDQYEKVLRAPALDLTCVQVTNRLEDAIRAEPVAKAALVAVRRAVESDPDLQAFSQFYAQRLAQESSRVERSVAEGGHSRAAAAAAREDLDKRLRPVIETKLIGWSGRVLERAIYEADVEMNGGRTTRIAIPVRGGSPVGLSLGASEPCEHLPCDSGHWTRKAEALACSAGGCNAVGCSLCEGWSTCAHCGKRSCSQHALFCAGCSANLCQDHAIRLADGRVGCAQCSGTCEITGETYLRRDLVTTTDTQQTVKPSLAVVSAASGRWLLRDRAVCSEVSGALCAPEELRQCAVTGKRVLPNELVQVHPSMHWVLRELAAPCEDTQQLYLKDDLATCCECGRRVGPGRLARCEITGKQAHPDHFLRCEKTGKVGLASEFARSAVSGKCFARSELVACEKSGALALPEELGVSEVSGKRVVPNLLVSCSVTGKRALREELVPSEISGLLALPHALLSCEVTGKKVLPQELGFCSVSGVRVLRSLLVGSSKSGRLALKDHVAPCAVCGRGLLREELVPCAVTGRQADPACMARSELSGALALPGTLVTCELTHRLLLPRERAPCEATGRFVGVDCLNTCAFTGKRVANDQLVPSALSSKPGWIGVMVPSAVSGGLGGPGELVQTVTSLKVFPHEAKTCPCCGRIAVFETDKVVETFVCATCAVRVCVADRPLGTDICRLCHEVFTAEPTESVPPQLLAAFPNARTWTVAAGVVHGVALGIPSKLAIFTRPRLLVVDRHSGEILGTRELERSLVKQFAEPSRG